MVWLLNELFEYMVALMHFCFWNVMLAERESIFNLAQHVRCFLFAVGI